MTRLKRKKELSSTEKNDVRFGTPQDVAEYRAKRICKNADTVIEVGAGAGFQTMAFAKYAKHVIAVEIDAERFERFTDVPENVTKIVGDALSKDVLQQIKAIAKGCVVVFLDPERPAQAQRRTLEEIEPNITMFIEAYGSITKDIAIELPPFLQSIPFSCEKEYLSIDGQLNRLTIYLGTLKEGDVSVIRLPKEERIVHTDPLPEMRESRIEQPTYILVPDKALAHAELTPLALPPIYHALELGNALVFLATTAGNSSFIKSYKIIGSGDKKAIERSLGRFRVGKIVLHGRMNSDQQRKMLDDLNKYCNGRKTAHLFLGQKLYLTTGE